MRFYPIRVLIKELFHRISFIVIALFVIQSTANAEEQEERYVYLKNLFSLLDPYLLPIGRPPHDLENIHDCNCPRVYWPACGHDNVTYVNGCIMNCLKKTTLRRFGPCIIYRRSGSIMYNVSFPVEWKNYNKTSFIGLRNLEKFDVEKALDNINEDVEILNDTNLVTYNTSLPPDWEDIRKAAIVLSNNSETESI